MVFLFLFLGFFGARKVGKKLVTHEDLTPFEVRTIALTQNNLALEANRRTFTPIISNSFFNGLYLIGGGNGAAIYFILSSADIDVRRCMFTYCGVRNYGGGAIYMTGWTLNISKVCGYDCECYDYSGTANEEGQFMKIETYPGTPTAKQQMTIENSVIVRCSGPQSKRHWQLTTVEQACTFNAYGTSYQGKITFTQVNVTDNTLNSYGAAGRFEVTMNLAVNYCLFNNCESINAGGAGVFEIDYIDTVTVSNVNYIKLVSSNNLDPIIRIYGRSETTDVAMNSVYFSQCTAKAIISSNVNEASYYYSSLVLTNVYVYSCTGDFLTNVVVTGSPIYILNQITQNLAGNTYPDISCDLLNKVFSDDYSANGADIGSFDVSSFSATLPPTRSPSPSPSASRSLSPSPSRSRTPTASRSISPTASRSPTPSPSQSPSPSPSRSPRASPSRSRTSGATSAAGGNSSPEESSSTSSGVGTTNAIFIAVIVILVVVVVVFLFMTFFKVRCRIRSNDAAENDDYLNQ